MSKSLDRRQSTFRPAYTKFNLNYTELNENLHKNIDEYMEDIDGDVVPFKKREAFVRMQTLKQNLMSKITLRFNNEDGIDLMSS